jgi:hypothetical protein
VPLANFTTFTWSANYLPSPRMNLKFFKNIKWETISMPQHEPITIVSQSKGTISL